MTELVLSGAWSLSKMSRMYALNVENAGARAPGPGRACAGLGSILLVVSGCALDEREVTAAGSLNGMGEMDAGTRGTAGNAPDGPSRGGTAEPPGVNGPPDAPGPDPLPGQLSSSAAEHDFGDTAVLTSRPQFSWVLQNTGGVALTLGQLTNSNPTDFQIDNRCTGAIAPGASCVVLVSFNPTALGPSSAELVLSADAGDTAQLSVRGTGRVGLIVQRAGAGTGTVVSDPPGLIDCGTSCSAVFDAATTVRLEARTSNGSNSYFSGWSTPECAGPLRDCTVPLETTRTVTATFSPMVNNLVFASSTSVATNLGSLAAYDAECNRFASDAGINDATGTGFLAAMSTTTTNLRTRFAAGVQGWVRLDGRPFATGLTDLFDRGAILYPIRYSERGGDESAIPVVDGDIYAMTGTRADGTVETSANCADWTSASADALAQTGYPTGGPPVWITSIPIACNAVPYRILCMGHTKSAPVAVTSFSGKRMWLSNTPYIPGSMTPDAKCTAERPAGVSEGRAVVPYVDRPAQAALDPSANYVRPDGQLVGTGQQIIDQAPLTGSWIHANGTIEVSTLSRVWSGDRDLTTALPADVTCDNWTSQSQTGFAAYSQTTDSYSFYGFGIPLPCTITFHYLYCVEP